MEWQIGAHSEGKYGTIELLESEDPIPVKAKVG